MNRVAGSLIRLYPAAWRKRYGAEFEAMLDEVPQGWFAVFDLFKGAIRMQLSVPSFPKLALMLSTVGLVVGFGVSYMVTQRYVSIAVMSYHGEHSDRRALLEGLQAMEADVLSRTSLSNMIQRPRLKLFPDDMARKPIEDVIEEMRKSIRITMANSGGPAFSISFVYPDPLKAQATMQALVTRFEDENLATQSQSKRTGGSEELQLIAQLESRIAALEQHAGIAASQEPGPVLTYIRSANANTLEVLDPPSLPVNPIYPNRGVIAAIGFIAGFVLAIIIAIFRRRFHPAAPLPASLA